MNCNICNGMCSKDVIHGQYIYWKCSNCFTSQVMPQPSEKELSQYYDSFHLSDALGGVYDEVEDRMKADFPEKVRMVIAHSQIKNPRLLDVGCGKGFFIKAALDKNINAEGIDISVSGVAHAVDVLGVTATVGKIEDYSFNELEDQFDVVTFWATIEHLPDPLSVLQAIHRCLKPGGILLCDTGIGNNFWEKLLVGHNQWFDAPQHLFVFSKKGLVILLEKAGFEIVQIDTNFERNIIRKWIKAIRHTLLCVVSGVLLTPLLGKRSVLKMKQEAKWSIGQLACIVATKEQH